MLHRKNKNLRLVRELEESVDKLADEIMTELNSEEMCIRDRCISASSSSRSA